jgi:hypothetical protein
MLKPGKDPTLHSSYRPISLLDTVGKLFEKILLARVLRGVSERGLLCDSSMGFDPGTARHYTWPAFLKESTETSTRGGKPARLS